jgi:lysozyme
MSDASDAIASPLIKHYESCDLSPYQKAGDVPTIGWGNTVYQDGRRVSLDDDPLTQQGADELFAFWLANFTKGVESHMRNSLANEVAAFTSLAYNIGLSAFAGSTALRLYLQSDKVEAGNRIEAWNKSGGQVLKGLQRRRRAEHLVYSGTAVVAAIAASEAAFP